MTGHLLDKRLSLSMILTRRRGPWKRGWETRRQKSISSARPPIDLARSLAMQSGNGDRGRRQQIRPVKVECRVSVHLGNQLPQFQIAIALRLKTEIASWPCRTTAKIQDQLRRFRGRLVLPENVSNDVSRLGGAQSLPKPTKAWYCVAESTICSILRATRPSSRFDSGHSSVTVVRFAGARKHPFRPAFWHWGTDRVSVFFKKSCFFPGWWDRGGGPFFFPGKFLSR